MATMMHESCYRARYSRAPLRTFGAKIDAPACGACGLHLPIGSLACYDVAPPNAKPKPVTTEETTTTMHETTPATTETTTPAPAAPAPDMGALATLVGAVVAPIVAAEVTRALASMPRETPAIDADAVKRIVVEHVATLDRPLRIELPAERVPLAPSTELAHCQLPELIDLLADGRHVWIWGGAGTGKTFVAGQAARALRKRYSMQGAIADRYAELIGFRSVTTGEYQSTAFRRAFENAEKEPNGWLHLIDEVDGSQDPGTPLAINAALANHLAPFPDGMIARCPHFSLIAAANTKGFGADADYVGRIRFDGAFLDRFTPLRWETDEKLERALWPDAAPRVQEVRARVAKRGIKVLVTPRASERLQALMSGAVKRGTMTIERAEALAVGGLMSDDQWGQVR